jgi:hypothetical protein
VTCRSPSISCASSLSCATATEVVRPSAARAPCALVAELQLVEPQWRLAGSRPRRPAPTAAHWIGAAPLCPCGSSPDRGQPCRHRPRPSSARGGLPGTTGRSPPPCVPAWRRYPATCAPTASRV